MSFRWFLLQYFCAMAFLCGLFGLLMTSLYRPVMGRDAPTDTVRAVLLTQVVTGTLISGLLTARLAIFMNVTTVTIPSGRREDFLSHLDDEMAKRRYRPGDRSKDSLVFVPRALVRPRVFHVHVGIGPDAVTLVGPGAVVKALGKRFAVERVPGA